MRDTELHERYKDGFKDGYDEASYSNAMKSTIGFILGCVVTVLTVYIFLLTN